MLAATCAQPDKTDTMKNEKIPITNMPPGWHTSHPVRNEDLNQDRMRELEKARIAHLPQTILHLENRIVSLHKQIAEELRLLDEARQNREARG